MVTQYMTHTRIKTLKIPRWLDVLMYVLDVSIMINSDLPYGANGQSALYVVNYSYFITFLSNIAVISRNVFVMI